MSTDGQSNNPLPTRREMLARAGGGFGSLALAGLLCDQGLLANSASDALSPLAARSAHFAPKARSVIFLFMYGGPSHLDLFDYKPSLKKFAGKNVDKKVDTKGARSGGGLYPSPYKFKRHGESGHWVSDRYPHLSRVIDHTAMLRGVYGHSISHAPALFEVNTGKIRTGFPSLGSWVTYGLGSHNQDLPGFVVMYDYRGGPIGGAPNWGSGFLPGAFQGTPVRSRGIPILNLKRPETLDQAKQRPMLSILPARARRPESSTASSAASRANSSAPSA